MCIFKKNDAGDYPTTAAANITAYTGEHGFGVSVALSSTHLVVGAAGTQKAFVFRKNDAGDYPTIATTIITTYTAQRWFGIRLALSSTYCVITNRENSGFGDKVFIFNGA